MTYVPNPSAPRLVGFSVVDDDNLDAVLSVGDAYHLTFDAPTDQHLCEPTCSGDRAYVLRLFTFSAPLKTDRPSDFWVLAGVCLVMQPDS